MGESTANSLDDILSRAKDPSHIRVATARILLEQNLLDRKAQLEAEITAAVAADARENRIPVAYGLARDMEALDAEIEAAKVEFKFRSVGKRAWADLLAAHPPTKEQAGRIRGLDHNPITFPCAALALTYVDPADDQWAPDTKSDVYRDRLAKFTELEQVINNSQFEMLWAKCVDANIGGLDTPKSLAASMILRANGQSATTPAPAGSLAQSS